MANILDYIDWRGDLTFKNAPFGEVDGIVLSLLSYMELGGIAEADTLRCAVTLREATDMYFEKYGDDAPPKGVLIPDEFPEFFRRAAGSIRYGGMRLLKYKSVISRDSETQFAAVCISVGDGSIFVSFRGTDDTLAGWKENFNMSFMDSIPAQRLALDYLCDVSRTLRGRIRVGGHSKGGNLSMYAAINAPKRVSRRIETVYNNDGPGFAEKMENMAGYIAVADRILSILPEFSVVGLLLENRKIDKIVKSNAERVWQHDPFSWEIKGGRFVAAKAFSKECLDIEKTIKSWTAGLSKADRQEFVEAVYKVLRANSAETLSDVAGDKMNFIRSLARVEPRVREVIVSAGKLLVKEGISTVQVQRKRRKTESGK